MSNLISPLDAAFLMMDTPETPMHVASLQIFSPPAGASEDYMQELLRHLRSDCDLASPWNLKRSRSRFSLTPGWEIDRDVDLDYHVRHLALPRPGGERELGMLVSSVHSQRLNQRRPLWECHVIEGLEQGRFAIYIKIHHALVDGVSAMRMLMNSMSTDANTMTPPPWAADSPGNQRGASTGEKTAYSIRERVAAFPELTQAAARLLRPTRSDEALVRPLNSPRSVLNGRVSSQRRFATQQLSLPRLKAVARAAEVSLNDVVLYVCSAALRRFLKESNALPVRSLTAMVPVSLRKPGDTRAGNAVGALLAKLGTDIADPRRRLEAIHRDTDRAKEHLSDLGSLAASAYSALFMAPIVLQEVSGLGGRIRPYFNITVSNVPGPAEHRYFFGARLEECYPVSVPTHGQSLNITCVSYAGSVNFGFVSCRDAVPHMQRLAVYVGEALEEIEQAYAISADKPKKQQRQKAKRPVSIAS